MYFVNLYGLHVYCALVDLDSSSSPGVRPTPGLTSNSHSPERLALMNTSEEMGQARDTEL